MHPARKKARRETWHPEQIKAAVRMQGTTLSKLATDNGQHDSVCRAALIRPCAVGERIISDFLNVSLHELWPARYAPNGQRLAFRHVRDENRAEHPRAHRQFAGAR